MKKNHFSIILSFVLSGCAMAPGMEMYYQPTIPGVKIVPITADLILDQELLKRRGESDLSSRLASQRLSDKQLYQYHIGQRDILNITVWDHPELTIPAGEFRSAEAAGHLVAEDGTIFYPYAGLVEVAGKTVAEVRKILTRRIAVTIADPQLDVRVAAFRSQKAYVVGEVTTPGPLPITDIPLTVVEAVNQAGGVTRESDMLNVILSRKGQATTINLQAAYEHGDISQNIVLQDGDILHVPDRNLQKVFVIGEVTRPSSYLMHKGRLSLSEAIADAGGVDRLASDPARIFVLRGTQESAEIYHLDSKTPEAMILGDKFRLKARDVVFVDTAEVVRWNRVIQNLLPTTTLLNNLSNIESQSFNLSDTLNK